jgi:hypothetical protein
MKEVNCIASLESYISEVAQQRELIPGETIAVWETSKKTIKIKGKWLSKSAYFPRWCIRWESNLGGMFSKGLAGYTGKDISNFIQHLPKVK